MTKLCLMSKSFLSVFVLCLMPMIQHSCLAVELDQSCSKPPYVDAKIIQFTVVQDLERARQGYQSGSVSCSFGPDQMSKMTFVLRDGTSTFFRESKSGISFSCSMPHKVGPYTKYDSVAITSHLIAGWVDAPLQFRNCIYAKPDVLPQVLPTRTTSTSSAGESPSNTSLNLRDNERRIIVQAIYDSNGNAPVAAKALGITERALVRKMKEYKVETTAN